MKDKELNITEEKLRQMLNDSSLIGQRKEDQSKFETMYRNISSVKQSLKEVLIPAMNEHKKTLYGNNGRDGIVSEVERSTELINTHIKSHWKFAGLIIGILTLFCGIVTFFK